MRILKVLLIAVLVIFLGLPTQSTQAEPQVTETSKVEAKAPAPTTKVSAKPELSADSLEPLVLDIIRRNPQVILDSVSQYQAATVRDRQIAAWKENLKNPIKVDLSRAAVLGRSSASLTLVEFADFQCPYCIQAHPTVKALLDKHKGQIRYAFLHLPLPNHPQAMPAAQAAWAATKQNKFFEYQDKLFQLGGKLEPTTYEAIAKDLGLNLEKFNADRNSPEANKDIESDMKQAEAIGVNGTPTFVLNGLMIRGLPPMEDFESAIALIKNAKA